MKNILTVFLFLFLDTFCHSQTVIAEFDLQGGHIDGIQAFPLSDSIFVSFSHRHAKKSFWVDKNGKKREVNLMVHPDAPIVGIQMQADDTLYYYYLNDIEGQLVLQVLEQAEGKQELKFARPIFPIAGQLLGIHVDEELVTVVSYMKKQDQLRILMLDGLQILHEHIWDVRLDFPRHIRSNTGFMAGNEMIDLNQADKKLKLYQEGKKVVITIDHEEPGLENRKTTIIRMDVSTGAKEIYTLQRNDYDKFVSFYLKDKVFQMSHSPKKYIRCDAFDLKSGELLFTEMFKKAKSMHDQKVIVHRGKSVEVGYSTLYEMVTVSETPAPSIIVQRTADSTQLRVILGSVHY